MNRDAIRAAVIDALRSVAPESDPSALDEAEPFRQALDLDSMDFLNFLVAVHKGVQVDVPEADYAKVQTLGGIVEYLQGKLAH